MNNNQILSAHLLDILFEGRNKEYGAYELRASYPRRVKKALSAAAIIVAATVATVAFSRNKGNNDDVFKQKDVITVTMIEEEKPEPPPTPPPMQQQEPPQVRTERLSTIRVVPPDEYDEPPPTQDDLKNAKIDLATRDGVDFDNIAAPADVVGEGKGIIEGPRREEEPEIWTKVEKEAEYPGGIGRWLKFLERNCNGQVASDNGAPAGKYTVVIRFVVDEEGNVSNLVAMTNLGYGMEEEAMRVIKKAAKEKWIPANQNGRTVKAYRSQPITFQVQNDY